MWQYICPVPSWWWRRSAVSQNIQSEADRLCLKQIQLFNTLQIFVNEWLEQLQWSRIISTTWALLCVPAAQCRTEPVWFVIRAPSGDIRTYQRRTWCLFQRVGCCCTGWWSPPVDPSCSSSSWPLTESWWRTWTLHAAPPGRLCPEVCRDMNNKRMDFKVLAEKKKKTAFGLKPVYYLTKWSASSERISSGQSLTLSSKKDTISSWVIKRATVCLLRSWQR